MAELIEIRDNVVKWAGENLGDKFSFRKNQLESIVYIIDNIINKSHETTVIQAPTGSGKSLICIISAGVLATYYGKKSYILASDLYLWSQYMDAINKFKLKRFGYLKGSIGNYTCFKNHMDYNLGMCKIQKVGLKILRNKESRERMGFHCVDTCQYMMHRFRAEKTDVTLLTYQLWLYQMNLVERSSDDAAGFFPRDVIFCDECHNIPTIVENFSKPVINVEADRAKIEIVLNYAMLNGVEAPACVEFLRDDIARELAGSEQFSIAGMPMSKVASVNDILDKYDYFMHCFSISSKQDNLMMMKASFIREFGSLMAFVNGVADKCLEFIKNNHGSDFSTKPSYRQTKEDKDLMTSFKILSWVHNYASMVCEFVNCIDDAGDEFVVVEKIVDRMMQAVSYELNCVKDDYLCYRFLMKNAKFKVCTSATVGNKDFFSESIGVQYTDSKQARYLDIPNIFDFTKSPIYYIPTYKMSYNRKGVDFPEIKKIIYKILASPQFSEQHGMINTGSYDNAKSIYDDAPPEIKRRLCMYITSKDKNEQIKKYINSRNNVIIGPTLVEGVDLPGDLCRFIIIAKVPYPNISSKTVKAKMNIFPLWYTSTTSNTIIQNIGRGVRNESDYCTTFILDGCFGKLYEETSGQYSPDIRNRIKVINS